MEQPTCNTIGVMSKEEYHYVFKFKQIGDNIRKAREAKRLSQEELAFLINSARNYIGCIERAEKFASVTMLKKIADALDLKLADLFKECD